ncbi:nuclear GTPase SLIP-GC isoform X2 [Amia ocellicauda]|uniref:nuclear GTPase SLIP-GC isoform X2 n=1 Tax=Amia ocellicauda TaxID=2972642 RepID=UPI003464D3FC
MEDSCKYSWTPSCGTDESQEITGLCKFTPLTQIDTARFEIPQQCSETAPGVYPCNAVNCNCCIYMKKGINTFKSTTRNNDHDIKHVLTCKSSTVIYVIQCKKCNLQHVGKTITSLQRRFRDHKSSIKHKKNQLLAQHFNSEDHSLVDLTIFPIDKVNDLKSLAEREAYWIHELGTVWPEGLNLEMNNGKKRKCEDTSPAKMCKKRRLHPVFSCEIEDLLNNCSDVEQEARAAISKVYQALERITSCEKEDIDLLENLKKRSLALKSKTLTDKIYIGVFGRTGVGKSSLINALLEEKQLLPAASGHACTSVFIHVQANTNSNKYRADIDFISKEDWEIELRFLVEIISGEDNSDDDMKQMAKEKVKAIYGPDGIKKSYDELVGSQNFPEIPPSLTKTLSFGDASVLSEEISCYIRSDSRSQRPKDRCSQQRWDSCPQRQYWPLVKQVTISVPNSPVLLERIVLVDLPGTGDANKHRDEMWKTYLSKCSSVWIVNDINRALSEKSAAEILENSLRNIAGGGECENITFICTKTDEMDPEEFKKNNYLRDEDLGLTDIKDETLYEQKEKQACILHRNELIKGDVKKLLSDKAKAFLLGDKEDSDDVFYTYTVSSKEFLKHKQGRKTTLKVNETELPLLMEHIKKLYAKHCEKAVKDYVSEVSAILTYLHIAKNRCEPKTKTQKDCMFTLLDKNLKKECENVKKILNDVHTTLEKLLLEGAKKAERNCVERAVDGVLYPINKDFRGYHKTLKALCRNSGSFRSGNGNTVDLNYTLTKPMYEHINRILLSTFRLNRGSRRSIKGILDSFQCDFISSKMLKTYKQSPMYLHLVCIRAELRSILSGMEREILQRKKIIYNSLTDSVKTSMLPAYQEGALIKGTSTLTHIQRILEDRIDASVKHMFQDAKEQMLRHFEDLKRMMEETMEKELKTSLRLALHQIPKGIIFPDVAAEFEMMKTSCEALNLQIFT